MRPSRRVLLVVAVVTLLVLTGCAAVPGTGDDSSSATDVDGTLELHHIDVGQADATLLITPEGETVLIDTGNWQTDGADVIDYLEARDIDRIDHLVATHAHADHIGGHAGVIDRLEDDGDGVGAAYDSGAVHTSRTYDDYLDAVEEHDVQLLEVADGDELPLEDDEVEIAVLNPPEGESGTDLHYNSVSLSVEFGEFTYLTTGDAEEDAERRMVGERSEHLESDAYQAGHHGSDTASTEPFLDATTPELAIISSTEESQYGHPHDSVLEEFDERGIETYWTGVHGDVVVTTDSESSTVSTEHESSSDPGDLLERKLEGEAEDGNEGESERPSIDTAGGSVVG